VNLMLQPLGTLNGCTAALLFLNGELFCHALLHTPLPAGDYTLHIDRAPARTPRWFEHTAHLDTQKARGGNKGAARIAHGVLRVQGTDVLLCADTTADGDDIAIGYKSQLGPRGPSLTDYVAAYHALYLAALAAEDAKEPINLTVRDGLV